MRRRLKMLGNLAAVTLSLAMVEEAAQADTFPAPLNNSPSLFKCNNWTGSACGSVEDGSSPGDYTQAFTVTGDWKSGTWTFDPTDSTLLASLGSSPVLYPRLVWLESVDGRGVIYGFPDGVLSGSWRTADLGVEPQPDLLSLSFYDSQTFVPIPGAIWLFGSGLIGLIGVERRKSRV